MRIWYCLCLSLVCTLPLALPGCSSEQERADRALRETIRATGYRILEAPPAPAAARAQLGHELFFSPDLSVDGSVSCATCHHPDFAGADGLPLPVGIAGAASTVVSQARLRALQDSVAHYADELVPRHSPSVINAALYRRHLFWDGRAQMLEDGQTIQAGLGLQKYNPENYQQGSLLQAQTRMPLSSVFEMKGERFPATNDRAIEAMVLELLRSSPYWCRRFREVYAADNCAAAITLSHLTGALAAFEETLIYVDTPLQRFVQGEDGALDRQQKSGAELFFTAVEDGGAGCAACHSGGFFTDEEFHNLAIPSSGKGANHNGWDYGRYNADKTAQRFRFRTPTLLNVELTAPYFHNGVAATLGEAIALHQRSFSQAPASRVVFAGADHEAVDASIAAAARKDVAYQRLPASLSAQEIADLEAFAGALTDPCLRDEACREQRFGVAPIVESERPDPGERPAAYRQSSRRLDPASIRQPEIHCRLGAPAASEPRSLVFAARDVGIDHQRTIGLIRPGSLIDVINYAGVSAVDVNNDCLDDLVFDAGSNGLYLYLQQPSGQFRRKPLPFAAAPDLVTALVMDIDGDYRWDLFMGSLGPEPASIVFDFLSPDAGGDDRVKLTKPAPPVVNATISDIDNDGDMDLVLALWRSFNAPQQEHIWVNDGHGNLHSHHEYLQLRQNDEARERGYGYSVTNQAEGSHGAADMTLTPNFSDIDKDGDADLLLAADFVRSQVLRNDHGSFRDITDKRVINESNGMGAAIADFNRDGLPDWFVTSIKDDTLSELTSGHRLYTNRGQGRFSGKIIEFGTQWSWGACAEDFDNDGWVDIFYVSGFGEPLTTAEFETDEQRTSYRRIFRQLARYHDSTTPILLRNRRGGGFDNVSARAGFDHPMDARGIACFDYQQDGDIDIVVVPLQGTPVLYENRLNNEHNWLALRLIGPPGNTEAIGAQVVLADSEGQRQQREVRFENNYVSRNPAQLHFGLGRAGGTVDLSIRLDSMGTSVEKTGLAVDQLHIIDLTGEP